MYHGYKSFENWFERSENNTALFCCKFVFGWIGHCLQHFLVARITPTTFNVAIDEFWIHLSDLSHTHKPFSNYTWDLILNVNNDLGEIQFHIHFHVTSEKYTLSDTRYSIERKNKFINMKLYKFFKCMQSFSQLFIHFQANYVNEFHLHIHRILVMWKWID